jgi:CDP-archaeol synthase
VAPVVLSGLTHVAVIKLGVMKSLASVPLDLGASVNGHRLFGENKTLRGAVAMVLATSAWVFLQVRISRGSAWAVGLSPAFEGAHPLSWGALAGAGYVAGELPNSFIKRQLGIAAGAAARGGLRALFWTVDQVDSVIGVLLFLYPVWHPSPAVVAALFGVTLLVHPLVAFIMMLLGLKARIG